MYSQSSISFASLIVMTVMTVITVLLMVCVASGGHGAEFGLEK